MKKAVGLVAVLCTLLIVGGVAFIKFNTGAAAEFTDNVLRPVLGNATVIYLERIFFNTSDKLRRATVRQSDIQAPQFNDGSLPDSLGSKHLQMNNLPVANRFTALKDEGVWKIRDLGAFPGQPVMAYTFVRPDPDRPYAIVTVVQLDMTKMNPGLVAGIKEPGGKVGHPGPGKVPADIVAANRLVAAFDGGFQYRDGQYGMIVGSETILPLQKDLGTVVGYKNGDIKIINFTGQNLGPDVAYVRQNCPILIENGQMSVTDARNKKLWGRTMTAQIYTWRTGIGLAANGNLLFAVGNSLTPATLAAALKMAGAENAIQLDINPYWVRFNIFTPLGNGKYSSVPLTRNLTDGSSGYLNGYSKDFFYVYKK